MVRILAIPRRIAQALRTAVAQEPSGGASRQSLHRIAAEKPSKTQPQDKEIRGQNRDSPLAVSGPGEEPQAELKLRQAGGSCRGEIMPAVRAHPHNSIRIGLPLRGQGNLQELHPAHLRQLPADAEVGGLAVREREEAGHPQLARDIV